MAASCARSCWSEDSQPGRNFFAKMRVISDFGPVLGVENEEISWNIVKYHEISWNIVKCHEMSWNVMKSHEIAGINKGSGENLCCSSSQRCRKMICLAAWLQSLCFFLLRPLVPIPSVPNQTFLPNLGNPNSRDYPKLLHRQLLLVLVGLFWEKKRDHIFSASGNECPIFTCGGLSVQSSCGSESKGYSLTAFAVSSDSQGKKQVACIILNVHLKCSGEDVDLNLFTGAMISQNRVVDPRNKMVPSCPSWVPHQMAQPVTDWHLSWWPHDKKRRSWALPAAAAKCLRTFGLDPEIPRNLQIQDLFNTVRDVSIDRCHQRLRESRGKLPMELNLFL